MSPQEQQALQLKKDESWRVGLLRHDLRELTRERRHLEAKAQERTLTRWELKRMEQLLDEVMVLLKEFGTIDFKVQS